jgi:hypothetical protein
MDCFVRSCCPGHLICQPTPGASPPVSGWLPASQWGCPVASAPAAAAVKRGPARTAPATAPSCHCRCCHCCYRCCWRRRSAAARHTAAPACSQENSLSSIHLSHACADAHSVRGAACPTNVPHTQRAAQKLTPHIATDKASAIQHVGTTGVSGSMVLASCTFGLSFEVAQSL